LRRRESRDGYVVESLEIDNGAGVAMPAYLLLPENIPGGRRIPAVLYCHWHGGQYDIGKEELFRTNAVPEPPGPSLVRRGWAVLAVDAAGFGERNGLGPGGPEDRGAVGETSAAKHDLWFGRTLWGRIVRDDQVALDYLCSRPEIDPSRIAVTGISMGATRSWWLMALDERPRTAVAVGCLTRYQDLIAAQGLRHHGIYYYVPGLLTHFDTEAVVALAAPRPVLFMTGDRDAGSPVSGVRTIESRVRPVYSLYQRESAFRNEIHEGVGHTYTPGMWAKTLRWLAAELGSAVPARPVRE
jgi:dienelactone hydrolase